MLVRTLGPDSPQNVKQFLLQAWHYTFADRTPPNEQNQWLTYPVISKL
jgi:hypothetical protein